MRILFCCQFYAPSVGGVQEVVRQLAERLTGLGHQVTVATSRMESRRSTKLNGVVIKEFLVAGNLVSGLTGEVRQYRDFVLAGNFDVMLVYAAQQWSFDALWDVLDQIPFPKVLVPCGFSNLFQPSYAGYFKSLPNVLKKFDHLIFNATSYRDINFVREHGLENISVIPNGASEEMFSVPVDESFRSGLGIPEDSFVFLTVGSFTGLKGHLELIKAFVLLQLPESIHSTLILNGNEVQLIDSSLTGVAGKLMSLLRTNGPSYAAKAVFRRLFGRSNSCRMIAESINRNNINKRVLIADFPRQELTQAFLAADLFVFASNIEYSPLVLFEAAAAGTPFLSVDVGNSAEIAAWTGGGVICPSAVGDRGYTSVNEQTLANAMSSLMQQKDRLKNLGLTGKLNWSERFTWGKITAQYEQVFTRLIVKHKM